MEDNMCLFELTSDNIDEAAAFSWVLCTDKKTRSYPLYTSLQEVKKEYFYRSTHENSVLITYYSDEKLQGVLCFYTIPEESYLQTTAFYVEESNNIAAEAFLDYLKNRYSTYSLYIGITKENDTVSKVLHKQGYALVDDCLDMRLSMKAFRKHIPCNNIIRVDEQMLSRYLDYHAEHFNDCYWNAARIKSDFSNWNIYISCDTQTVTGGMFIKCYPEGIAEIFGIEALIELDGQRLIEFALSDIQNKYNNITSVVFMLSTDKKLLIRAVIESGFTEENNYCCWVKQILERKLNNAE